MREVFVVVSIGPDGQMQLNGVFSTRERAAAVCRTEDCAVVTFPLDEDCSEERTFEIEMPKSGIGPQIVTA